MCNQKRQVLSNLTIYSGLFFLFLFAFNRLLSACCAQTKPK